MRAMSRATVNLPRRQNNMEPPCLHEMRWITNQCTGNDKHEAKRGKGPVLLFLFFLFLRLICAGGGVVIIDRVWGRGLVEAEPTRAVFVCVCVSDVLRLLSVWFVCVCPDSFAPRDREAR
ncbi:hypothetical protein BC832DRAFT_567910 [Gaertneriomyces semiglobifer]|nr:hypothetical protein BC832DRAFT_567910 [Gaertneriomyces semiglobifer]